MSEAETSEVNAPTQSEVSAEFAPTGAEAIAAADPPPINKKKAKKMEQERLRLLEEAQKAEEAELLRLELVRQADEEAAAKKAEEERIFTEATIARFSIEEKEDEIKLNFRKQRVEAFVAKTEDADEWVKYIACNPLPGVELPPYQERSLNTFMSMIRELDDEKAAEEFLNKPHEHLPKVLRECERTEEVLALLDFEVGKARQSGNTQLINWCREYASLCRLLTQFKLDKITVALLHQAEDYEDPENHLMTKDFLTPNISFGLWTHMPPKSNFSKVNRITFKDIAFDIELPGPLRSTRTAIRVVHTAFDSRAKDDSKAREWSIVGGTVSVQQLALPPAPKKVKGWTLREISPLSRKIQSVPYPVRADVSSGNAAQSGPLKVKYRLPDSLLIRLGAGATPEVGYWDDKRGQWQTEGADGNSLCEKYDPETRTVVLSLPTLAPFAILQPRFLDFPYLHWGLAPMGRDAAVLKVLGSRFEVAFEFSNDGKCKLLSPSLPQFANVLGVPMHPGVLLTKLAKQGLNVMPTDDDAVQCRKPLKSVEGLEGRLHRHVATVCGVFAMKASRYNSSRGPAKCMFQARLAKESFAVKELPVPDPGKYAELEEKERLTKENEEAKQLPASRAATPLSTSSRTSEPVPGQEEAGKEAALPEPENAVPDWVQVLAEPDRFSLTINDAETACEHLLNSEQCHTSLRRCLSRHYDRPYVHAVTNVAVAEALEFMDHDLVGLQEGVLNFLNLLRPFVFH